jgi:RsmE family RNA methyltransferase
MQWRIRCYRVLRLSAGDWICLLDGAGGVYLAQLGESGRIETLQPSALATELPFAVTVLQAMVRPEKAETAIRLCVQAGARAIWLAPSERSVAQLEPAKQPSRESRWQRIAQEEAELACRSPLARSARATRLDAGVGGLAAPCVGAGRVGRRDAPQAARAADAHALTR